MRHPSPCSHSPLPRLSHQQLHPWPPADNQGQTPLSFLRCCRGTEGLQRGWAEAPRLGTASAFWPLLHLSWPLSFRTFTTGPSTILPFIHPTHMPIQSSFLQSPVHPEPAWTSATGPPGRATEAGPSHGKDHGGTSRQEVKLSVSLLLHHSP